MIPHVKLPQSVKELPEQRYGHWIIAGTPGSEPYPCTCWYMPCRGRYGKCPDAQRTEGEALPEGCCGRRNTPVADLVPVPDQSAVGRSALPEPPTTAPEAASGELGPPRAAFSCDCVTPWDPPAPVLLIAAGKNGPVQRHVPVEKATDVRAAGDEALSVLGRRRVKPWKDGRHVLLPPQPGARGKTRPCWHAQLDDGTLAVLDTPDETGSGIHCAECHRDFHNAGAWEMHRTRGRYGLGECKDPATVLCIDTVEVVPARFDVAGEAVASRVRHVTRGAPMLKRTAGGVWMADQLAPWGLKGPSMTRDEASSIWSRAQERLGGARCVGCLRARRGRPGATEGHTESGPWEFGCGHNRDHQHNA